MNVETYSQSSAQSAYHFIFSGVESTIQQPVRQFDVGNQFNKSVHSDQSIYLLALVDSRHLDLEIPIDLFLCVG